MKKFSDFLCITGIFFILMLFPLVNGFPFIYHDSYDYIFADYIGFSFRSPVIPLLSRTCLPLFGAWYYIVLQNLFLTFALFFLYKCDKQKFKFKYIFTAIILSCVWLYSGVILADIWILICLIFLYLQLTNKFNFLYLIFSVFAIIAHYGNILIFVFTGLAVILFEFRLLKKKTGIILLNGFISIIILILINFTYTKKLQYGPTLKYTFLMGRVLYNIPSILDNNKEVLKKDNIDIKILKKITRKSADSLVWDKDAKKLRQEIGTRKFENICKQLFFKSLYTDFFEHIYYSIKNTFYLSIRYNIADGYRNFDDNNFTVRGLKINYFNYYIKYKNSLQGSGRLVAFLKKIFLPIKIIYIFSIIFILFYLVKNYNKQNKEEYIFVYFCLSAIVINAFFMSFFSGIVTRYQLRIGFLPILSLIIIINSIFKGYVKNDKGFKKNFSNNTNI